MKINLVLWSIVDNEGKKLMGNLAMPPPSQIETHGESWDD